MQKKSWKFAAFAVLLVLLSLVLLTACESPTTGFKHPSMPASGEVVGNGGLTVRYGDYIYYVNGYQSSNTAANGYTGQVKSGDIVRITIEDFKKVLALNDDDTIESGKLSAAVTEKVYEYAEVVVPLFYYSENTSDTALNGLFIYGERLYFTSPNTARAANGSLKNDQLTVCSAKLDGSDLQTLYTFDSISQKVMITENGGKVYATYVLTENSVDNLYNKELTSNAKAVKIAEDMDGETFDVAQKAVYYINSDSALCLYTAGNDKEKVLVENKDPDNVTFKIVSANEGYVYYTADYGVHAVKEDYNAKKILDTVPDDDYFCYGEKVVTASKDTTSTGITGYSLYVTDGDASTKDYIIPLYYNDKEIKLTKVQGDLLYYTRDGKTWSVDLSKPAAERTINELYTTFTSSNWADVDSLTIDGATYYFILSSSEINCKQYVEKDGAKTVVTTSLQVTVPTTAEE